MNNQNRLPINSRENAGNEMLHQARGLVPTRWDRDNGITSRPTGNPNGILEVGGGEQHTPRTISQISFTGPGSPKKLADGHRKSLKAW